MKACGSEHKVGNKAIEVRLNILESLIMPSILHNTETWTNITTKKGKS